MRNKSFLAPAGGVRYKDEVFTNVDTTSFFNGLYRVASFNNNNYQLKFDAYLPQGDTASLRPAIMHIHGGSFTGGTRKDDSLYLRSLAKRGFVVISIDYRLGMIWPSTHNRQDSITSFFEAVYRADQDARAAIRFVRKFGSLARIDTNKIFISGQSAGSATAINVAYLDQNEVPSGYSSKFGPLDGTGTYDYPGYSTKVKVLINREAPIVDTNWMRNGDAPVISLVGTADEFYNDSINRSSPTYNFNNVLSMHRRAVNVGIPQFSRYFIGGIHGCTIDSLSTTLSFITDKLYPFVIN